MFASDPVLPRTKPYWDSALKDLHVVIRDKRQTWIKAGRPRGQIHPSYPEYKSAKYLFRVHHRRCADTELNIDIDQAAEVDSALFWKKINSRRKFSSVEAGCEMKFGTTNCRDLEQIASGWGNYFRDLYADTEGPHYDSNLKQELESRVRHIKAENQSEQGANNT